jgi:broad specificity phosphatase PhoE
VDRLLLARHGESEYSVRAAVSGDPRVPVRLTEVGREQARRLGEALRDEPIELCVVSEFARVVETADIALAGRAVPRLVLPDLNDPRAGSFEGGPLDEYRAWAHAHTSSDEPPGRGESRAALVRRYVRGYRTVLARPERLVLVVGHSLPFAYLLGAVDGKEPSRSVPLVEYAYVYRFSAEELAGALERLETWCGAPTW